LPRFGYAHVVERVGARPHRHAVDRIVGHQ
jgi:hypothetical protein